uniref:Macaca fascicularis brain cDNA clone: QmoA-12278, similar to human sphingomyelin phosphodiesterase, acid-like 3A (SMPDL3A), mRNA, RefSeq: NM_006714.2 n=1 Tax=Macaca fascicularis TaxID=9541 RepID=I7G8R5_MACFA|nr:unnamed protein product [Macaca fascicularis]
MTTQKCVLHLKVQMPPTLALLEMCYVILHINLFCQHLILLKILDKKRLS